MNIEIANRLLELRKEKNFSQEELAEKIGVSRQAVSKWERAESSPDTDNLIELARLYEVSLDELLFTTEPIPRKTDEDAKPKEYVSVGLGGIHVIDGDTEVHVGNVNKPLIKIDGEELSVNLWQAVPYPIIVTIIYLVMGFGWRMWHPGWIVFLTIPVYYAIAAVFWGKKEKKNKKDLFYKSFLFYNQPII